MSQRAKRPTASTFTFLYSTIRIDPRLYYVPVLIAGKGEGRINCLITIIIKLYVKLNRSLSRSVCEPNSALTPDLPGLIRFYHCTVANRCVAFCLTCLSLWRGSDSLRLDWREIQFIQL